MYHCNLCFCLVGEDCRVFELLRQTTPLEHFTHRYIGVGFDDEQLASADVVIANLCGADAPEALSLLRSKISKDAELILVADTEQVESIADSLDAADDLWTLPMTDGEIRFRVRRHQELCKRAKDAWQLEHYLDALTGITPSMVWFKTKDGIHERVNEAFCRTVGKERSTVEGRDHCFIWDATPEEAEVCAISDRKVMDSGGTVVGEELVMSGGEEKLLNTYKAPLYDLDGSIMGTVGLGIDITQERAYQQEIIAKTHTLETIFTTLECGVICHSCDGKRIISVNQAALSILDYKSKEEMALRFDIIADSVFDEDKPMLRERIQSLKKEGDSVGVEYRVMHKNGDILHVMGNVKLIREHGELLYQRFLLDVTAQKLQEKENARRQDELVRALTVDYSLVCYFDIDSGLGKVIHADESLRDSLRGTSSDLAVFDANMEGYIDQSVYPADRDMFRRETSLESIAKDLSDRSMHIFTFRSTHGGEIKYQEMKIVRSGLWDDRNHIFVMGIRSTDAETRKEMAQRQLLEDALEQANRANKAKSTFLSNMSHDMRTPLNAIVGFTNLSIAHIDDRAQVDDYLGKIMSSGKHLLALINNVLDMSRIESGKLQLENEANDLDDIVGGLISMVEADANAKRLHLTSDMSAVEHKGVLCDRLRLGQVLINIISNSIKYTEEGGTIDLSVAEQPSASDKYAAYTFTVRDNGIGMPKEFIDRIFEPFEREKNTTLSGIHGTGLGMSITKNIVDMMGGSISVESEQGVGTTVTVSLTFPLSSELPHEQADNHAGHSEHTAPSGRRILLVEDNELNQEIALMILSDAGFEAELAENGKVAVDKLSASAPGYYDLILMDIQMPVMSGYEAARAIRALPNRQLASIPIIAMTANAFEEDRREALKAGMNGHIAKPIDVPTLLDTLNEILS